MWLRLSILISTVFVLFTFSLACASPYYGENALMPHSTSTFAKQTAHSMVEAVKMKADWLRFLGRTEEVKEWFITDQANSFQAVQHFQGFYLMILAYAGSAGGKIPKFAEITAANMYHAVEAKAEVLRFLATDLYPQFADNLATTFVMRMEFTAKFFKMLFEGF